MHNVHNIILGRRLWFTWYIHAHFYILLAYSLHNKNSALFVPRIEKSMYIMKTFLREITNSKYFEFISICSSLSVVLAILKQWMSTIEAQYQIHFRSSPRQLHYREGKVHCKNNLMAWPPSWNLAVSQKKLPRLSNNALHTGDVFITFFKKGCPPKETDERVWVHFETRRWITDFALLNHDCLITLFYQLPFLSQRKSSYKHTEMQSVIYHLITLL